MKGFLSMHLVLAVLLVLGVFGGASAALADSTDRAPLGEHPSRAEQQDATATPVPGTTPTSSPLVSDDPAVIQALIQKAIARTMALSSYKARIGYVVGDAWVQDTKGDYNGKDARFTNDSDWYSEYSETIVKNGAVYTRKAGDDAAPWQAKAEGVQTVAYGTEPLVLLQQLVTEPSSFRFQKMNDFNGEQCAVYVQEHSPALGAVLEKESIHLRFPITEENSGGVKDTATGLSICPSGYMAGVMVIAEFNQYLAPMQLFVNLSDFNQVPAITAPPGFTAPTVAATRALTPTLVLSPTLALSPTLVVSPTRTVTATRAQTSIVISPTVSAQVTSAPRTATRTASPSPAVTKTPTKPAATRVPTAAPAAFNVTWNKGFEYLARDGNSFWCQMHNQVQNLTDQDMPFQSPDVKLVDLLMRKPEGPLGGFQPIVGIANGDGSIAEWQLAGWYAKAFGWRNGIEKFPPDGIPAKGDTGDWTWYGVNQAEQYCKYVYVKWNGHTVAAEFSPQGELINPNAVLPAGAP